jgi:L-lactate dehydrogenase (cytochrome)
MRRLDSRLRNILNLNDFEKAAKRHLPRSLFGYVSGASEDGVSVSLARDSFQSYGFVPRTLVDVSIRSTETTLFGKPYAAPFGLAPMGISALSAYQGDLVLTRAARAANVPMILSSSSLTKLEDIFKANQDAWFQAYLPGEETRLAALLDRVKLAGYQTLVVTVDTPVSPNRENNVRSGFSMPLRPTLRLGWDGLTHPQWLFGTFLRTLVERGVPHFENNYAERGAPVMSPTVLRESLDRGYLTWRHIEIVRRLWPGKLVIKGVLSAEDARISVESGADGIIVSNHGGRQLDGAVAPLSVLQEIVTATPSVPIMLDSGLRRGTDVIKALALGAKFVFIGRPFNYAASIGGFNAVSYAIRLLQEEIWRDMGMIGVTSINSIHTGYVRRLRPV